MNQSDELNVVKEALRLEKETLFLKNDYINKNNEQYPDIISPPVKQIVQRPSYPAINTGIKFSIKAYIGIAFLILLVGMIIISNIDIADTRQVSSGLIILIVFAFLFFAWLIGFVVGHNIRLSSKRHAIQNAPEYKAACRAIDNQYQQALINADTSWKLEMEKYNTVTIPEYNKKKAVWMEDQKQRVNIAKQKYNTNTNTLAEFYNRTKLIPEKYHNIEALEYIFSILNSSQYTLKEAIDNYERHIQQQIDLQKIQAQNEANAIAYEQAQYTAEQNNLLDENNRILDQARREQYISNFVGAVQRHNTNKKLDKLLNNK